MTTQLDEVGLEAARKQKIRNLQLKTMCLENEEFIQELHITDFSQTQKSKLDAAHEKASKLIKNVEQGTKWNLTPVYDLQKLLRVCGLQMNPKELAQPTDQAQFMDIISLRKTLQELRQHKNKNKVISISDLLERYIARLDEAEASLRRSQVDATDIAAVPAEALKVVEDCMNVQGTFMSTASIDERVKQQLKLIERANEVQNIALADGEMSVAEEQYYTKISLQEMLLQLVNNKFLILDATREQNIPFKDKRPVEVKAHQTTSQIHERKRKLKEKCEADLAKLHDALRTADTEDRSAMQRHAQAQQYLEAGLVENIRHQDECWARIQEMERELQRLGTHRFEEVKRMLEECDKEEKRRVEYNQFLEVVTEHRRALELTVYNCDVTMSLTGIVEGLVSECVEYVMKRYETTEKDIAEGRLEIYKEQLEAFRQLYLTLGQLLYKKEKALEEIDQQIRVSHIQLEFCIETFDPLAKKHSDEKKELYSKRAMCEEELEMIKEKMMALADQFAPTEDILTRAGIDFLHPARELEETNLHRRTKLVGYAQTLQQREEEKIIREREDIKRSAAARSPRYPALPPSGSPSPSPRVTSPPAARLLGPCTPTPP